MRLETVSEIVGEMETYEEKLWLDYGGGGNVLTLLELEKLQAYHTDNLNMLLKEKYEVRRNLAKVHFSLTQGIFITINDLF